MPIIKVMDEILANKIAAGEVVERCASVVKELVENSIDAESTEIKIELIESGTREIKVTDNGKGMEKEDAVLAFSRHATSKIVDEDDLYHIDTLGFRGEALASIASVSDATLKTSIGDIGTFVHIKGGKVLEVTPDEARRGTIMCVKDLFYNTPARLKHMKSLYTELASITEYINKLALSHPNIKFVLTNNGTTLLNTDGSGMLLKTIKSIYGITVARKMMEIKGENDDYFVEGFVSIPEVHRANRNHMVTLVNGRVVRNAELNRVINDSYHSFKPDNRYPITVLNITVDPSLIDVNIHPTKMDIKFSKLEDLSTLIEKLIKNVLHKKVLIPEAMPKEVKKEEKTNAFVESIRKPIYREQKLEFFVSEPEESESKEIHFLDDEPVLNINTDLVETNEEIVLEHLEEKENENRLPDLYPVGLVHGTYIICQNDLGMYLIDQHAAKERVNYEMYKKKLGNPPKGRTSLIFPFTMELSNNEYIILKENFDVMENLGFEIEEFGVSSVIIKAHPTWLPKGYEEAATRKVIDVILEKEKNFTIEKFNEKVATMLSCKMAIKANMNISEEEMKALIEDLRKCDNPFNCPHGRPTIIFYSNYDLEKLFKRSGFDQKQ